MGGSKLWTAAGYTISGVTFLAGIVVLTGSLLPSYLPDKFRVMFGVVLLLYGVYRFVTLRLKQQQRDEEQLLP